MNVLEKIKQAISILNEIDEYDSSLNNKLSTYDLKQADLLHYIENNKLTTAECYRVVKEIKNIREHRRKVKNDMEILSKYNQQKARLNSKDNRQLLIAELHKRVKQQGVRYNNKGYSNEELKRILGKEVSDVQAIKETVRW